MLTPMHFTIIQLKRLFFKALSKPLYARICNQTTTRTSNGVPEAEFDDPCGKNLLEALKDALVTTETRITPLDIKRHLSRILYEFSGLRGQMPGIMRYSLIRLRWRSVRTSYVST